MWTIHRAVQARPAERRQSEQTAPPGRELSGRANLPLSTKSERPQPRALRNRGPRHSRHTEAEPEHGVGRASSAREPGGRSGRPRAHRTGSVGADPEKRFPSIARVVSRCAGFRGNGCRTGQAGTGPGVQGGSPFRSGGVRVPVPGGDQGGGGGGTTGPDFRRAAHTGPAAGLQTPACATRPAPPARGSDRGLGTQPGESALFGR